MKLNDLQSDPFAKTIIKRSSSVEREQHLKRVLRRLQTERKRLEEISEKIGEQLLQSGIAFRFTDNRSLRPDAIRIKTSAFDTYVLPQDISPKLVDFLKGINDRLAYLKREMKHMHKSLDGILGARTRAKRKAAWKKGL